MTRHSNERLGLLVTFNTDDSFTIIGDEELVSDAVLLALHEGEDVNDWELV
jgi:hypothetical protein